MLEYRSDVLVWTVSGAIVPLVGLLVWLSISSTQTLKFTQSDLILYFIFVMIVEVMVGAWGSWFISEQINTGAFSKYLLKPTSVFTEYLSQNLCEKIFKLSFLSIVILFLISSFSQNLNFSFNLINTFLFFISLLLAIFLTFVLDMVLGLSAFWFHEIDFFKNWIGLANQLFSGKLIPIVFLPGVLFNISIFLPFRYFISFPVEVLLNKITPIEILYGFLTQIFWVAVFFGLYKLIYIKGIKLYQGYGG